jgi:hypothetical protein
MADKMRVVLLADDVWLAVDVSPSTVVDVMFQPFLRFYMPVVDYGVAVEAKVVFQPFLRFYYHAYWHLTVGEKVFLVMEFKPPPTL